MEANWAHLEIKDRVCYDLPTIRSLIPNADPRVILVKPDGTRQEYNCAEGRAWLDKGQLQIAQTLVGTYRSGLGSGDDVRAVCALVTMELVSRLEEDGIDVDKNIPKWKSLSLSDALNALPAQRKVVHSLVKMQASVDHIGLNTLVAWGVLVDPILGLLLPRQT
eukprot:m51a1_g14389 hypothetical protein (164) ;mRNA; r:319972-320515